MTSAYEMSDQSPIYRYNHKVPRIKWISQCKISGVCVQQHFVGNCSIDNHVIGLHLGNGFCYNICKDKWQVAYPFYLIHWYNVGGQFVINPV